MSCDAPAIRVPSADLTLSLVEEGSHASEASSRLAPGQCLGSDDVPALGSVPLTALWTLGRRPTLLSGGARNRISYVCGQMDLSAIGTGSLSAGRFFRLRDRGSHNVEFVTVLPDELDAAWVARAIQLGSERLAPSAHRQDQLLVDRVIPRSLCRPIQGEERFLSARQAQPGPRWRLVPAPLPRLRFRQDLGTIVWSVCEGSL